MLDDLREAWVAGNHRALLSLALRDFPCSSDAERAELLYYRAITCCAFYEEVKPLRRWHLPFAERAAALMREQRHPLLFRALWSSSVAHAKSGNPITSVTLIREARALPSQDPVWQLVLDGHAILNNIAGERTVTLWEPVQRLRVRFKELQRDPSGSRVDLFRCAFGLAEAALVKGDPLDAHPYISAICDFSELATPISAEEVLHSCTLAHDHIALSCQGIGLLARVGALTSVAPRLRSLHRFVTTLPHVCLGADYLLCVALAEAALAFGSPSASIFARAAMRIYQSSCHRIPFSEWRLTELLCQLPQAEIRPQRGETAALLDPEAWPLWPGPTDDRSGILGNGEGDGEDAPPDGSPGAGNSGIVLLN